VIRSIRELLHPKLKFQAPWSARFLFWVLALIMISTMLIASADFGITWDEWVHAHYGKLILRYFLTGGQDHASFTTSADIGGDLTLNLYGHLFDTVATFVFGLTEGSVRRVAFQDIHWSNYYEVRHLVNAAFGFAAILFTGLLAREFGGWRLGCLALLFIFLSPRFFGHSMNNPKDIPFATMYVMSIYYLVRFLRELPKPKWRTLGALALGIALAINVRIGGIILHLYLWLFCLSYLVRGIMKHELKATEIQSIIFKVLLVSAAGYFGGLIFWPYGHHAPIQNPLNALRQMSDYNAIMLGVLFEGKKILSTNVPWHYIPKWILITTPMVVLLGWCGVVIQLFRNRFRLTSPDWLGVIVLAALFPIGYAIFKHSALYDGWRHMLLVYPPLVILAVLGWQTLFTIARKRWIQGILLGFLILLLGRPLAWMVKNHPHQYVYFNETVGGLDGAFGYYETDYWGNSLRQAAEWLAEDLKQKADYDPIVVSSDGSTMQTAYYLKAKLGEQYTPLLPAQHGLQGWDYGLALSRKWTHDDLLSDSWPPEGTIYTVKADHTVLCAVVKNPVPKWARSIQARLLESR